MKRNFSKTVCGMIAKGHHMCVSVTLEDHVPMFVLSNFSYHAHFTLFNHSDLEFT